MKLVTILICVQAILMIASIAGTGYIMYNVNGSTKTGSNIFKDNSFIFYTVMALHSTSLIIHGLSTFWCRK